MKKYLLIFSILAIGLTACKGKEELPPKESEVVQEVSVTKEEEKYKDFQETKIAAFSEKGVKEVRIVPFAKGIDIIFLTEKKDWKENEFMEVAKKTVEDFKKEFEFTQETEIGVSLEYQSDASQNAETLFVEKIK